MSYIKSPDEFQKMKEDVIDKVDAFLDSYDKFTKQLSPSCWRSSGDYFSIQALKNDIDNFKQCTQKDVDNEYFRKEVMTEEEKEKYNREKKYNI